MNKCTCNPLVSVCVKSFNQRQFLDEVLDGVFAQTYRPLEIIVSDDGSSDGSWDLIVQRASEFRSENGDVEVVLNRNETNVGNFGNWQKCCELAHGELLIKADGDDVSLPDRAKRIVEEWVKDGCRASIIYHAGYKIDPKGRPLGGVPTPNLGHSLGALSTYSRDCYVKFPKDIKGAESVDDVVYTWRARCVGSALGFDDKLVKYRVGTGVSTSLLRLRESQLRVIEPTLIALDKALADLFEYSNTSGCDVSEVVQKLREERDFVLDSRSLMSSRSYAERKRSFCRINQYSPCHKFTPNYFHRLCFLAPRIIGSPLLFIYAGLNYIRRLVLR